MFTKIFKHQVWHILLLTVLLVALYFYTSARTPVFDGTLWGIHSRIWFIIAVIMPIIHQIYVLVCWRLELHFGSLTKSFGNKGFIIYKKGFAVLILSRLVTITLLAISNAQTVAINPVYAYTLAGILVFPTAWLFYSVVNYFGMDKAFGIDHFKPHEVKNEPFVKQGIYKYTSNGMYVYGFFLLWIPAVIFRSEAALVLALFNHLYIWVHYYFTELPDMNYIYGERK